MLPFRLITTFMFATAALSFTDAGAQTKPAAVPARTSAAPTAEGPGLRGDSWYAGPRVSSSSTLGANVERILVGSPRTEFANGRIGVGAAVDYYSASFLGDKWSVIPISGFVNYHFAIPDIPKLDPFVGGGLGYVVSQYRSSTLGYSGTAQSGLFFVAQAGARYFFTPRIAAQAQVGAGLGSMSAGVTFGF